MKQFRRQFLRLPDRPRGLMEIVQAFRLGQIQRSKIFPASAGDSPRRKR